MYAFLSHHSACEALRQTTGHEPLWPTRARTLPQHGDCVSTQRAFAQSSQEIDFPALGVSSSPVDLLVPTSRTRSQVSKARFHVWGRRIPAHSMLRLSDKLLVSGPELVILQFCSHHAKLDMLLDDFCAAVAAEQEALARLGDESLQPVLDSALEWERIRRLVAATVVACEFAGTYRICTSSPQGKTRYHQRPLMTRASLDDVAHKVGTTAIEQRAHRVASLMLERSASPMETALSLMLTLPVEFGGFGLPQPELNAAVDVSGVRGLLAHQDTVSPDELWRDARVAIEYDSAEFHEGSGPSQLTKDALRSNVLTALGYRVFRVTPGVIQTVSDISLLARQVAHSLAITLEEPTDIQLSRRYRLFTLLMPRDRRRS